MKTFYLCPIIIFSRQTNLTGSFTKCYLEKVEIKHLLHKRKYDIYSAQKLKFSIMDFFIFCAVIIFMCGKMFFMASICIKIWTSRYINVLPQPLRMINYVVRFFSPGRSHLTVFFWLKLLFWYLMGIDKRYFSL